ncbi:DNA polymerase III subunit beta [Ciceribacter ferrooxidans]|uniref:Beta sliding clamp n=1 Tax=Ciceribacter ferrooxidans TaxID=2509717 RepID=A0A4Q2SWZ3_9HYPH|nr:DNA polymerase III subunit beta [Ciceribacter ferrooxidans]RYC10133.1 DNA polymerase III subunit beta [Ciceribacter ferrooxidans]
MLTVSKTALTSALAFVADIVERRSTIPILQNVLFERGGDGKPILRMTDMDIEASLAFPAELAADFRPFTVQAHLLREIARKLPDGADAAITAADPAMGAVKLRAGRSIFSLQVLPEGDFPTLPAGNIAWRRDIPARALLEAIGAVAFAISTEETRYYLNGIFFHATEAGVMLVATDGHRLAKRFVTAEGADGELAGVIIPRKTVSLLSKIIAGAGKEAVVSVSGSEENIRFELPGVTVTSKLIDGTYPEYRRVIPAEGPVLVEIEGPQLRAAVDRVGTVATDRGRAIKFSFAGGQLTLSMANPDAGSSEESLPHEGQAEIMIGFNGKYVLDALTHLPDGTVTMSMTDAGSPAVLRADGDHVENLIVLMPMRT